MNPPVLAESRDVGVTHSFARSSRANAAFGSADYCTLVPTWPPVTMLRNAPGFDMDPSPGAGVPGWVDPW
jgi:hypothetical protein